MTTDLDQVVSPWLSESKLRSHTALVDAPPLPQLEVCVVIPVRDEAHHLENTLAALAAQTELDGRPLATDRYEILLLANNCADPSAAVARAFGERVGNLNLHVAERTFPSADAHVGYARRLLMDEAWRRLTSRPGASGVIASTDGDSRPEPTWLAATLREIATGADAVGGRILLDPPDDDPANRSTYAFHLRDTAYRLLASELRARIDPDLADPWPRHHQHFGASLAVTADCYDRAGRLPPITPLEDVAFIDALRGIDAKVRHSPLVRVRTSARRSGRVSIGLSTQLEEWAAMGHRGQVPHVDGADIVANRAISARSLRALWDATRTDATDRRSVLRDTARFLAIDAEDLDRSLDACDTFGRFTDRIASVPGRCGGKLGNFAQVPITVAIAQLRATLAHGRRFGQSVLPSHSIALQEVEAKGCRPIPVAPSQPERTPNLATKRVVDLVAAQGVVVDIGRPMDQEQMTASDQRPRDGGPSQREIGPCPVVSDL